MADVRETIDLFQRSQPGAALATVRSNNGKILMDDFRRRIDELRAQEDRELEDRTAVVRRNLKAAMWIDAGAGFGLLMLGAILYTISRDIARREVLEAALRESATFQERFVGILGHDLRNPLNAISGSADLLLRRRIPSEAQPASFQRIASSAARMRRMVNQLLDLTRVRLAGGMPVAPKPGTNLAEVARNAVEELRAAHPEAQLTVWAPPEISGEWDADRLAQMVSNVAHGGTIDVLSAEPSGTTFRIFLPSTRARSGTLPR